MKRLVTVFLSLLLITFSSGAYAASLTVDVIGLEGMLPDTIWSYQINFDVVGATDWFIPDSSVAFNEVDQHKWEAAPGFFLTNWNLNSNLSGNQLIILADDKDFGDPAISPLVNGILFTIQYPDEVQLSLALDSFILGSDLVTRVDMIKIPDLAGFGSGDNTLTFNAVPIPSALLLFGGGLLGLLGIRRKLKE